MNDYKELSLKVSPCSEDATDLLAAFLADIGYESFVPGPEGLTAYIPLGKFDQIQLSDMLNTFPMPVTFEMHVVDVPGQDWNHEWERNYFKPIVVGDRVAIHSSFHTDVPQAEYDIVIDPKMAFGTGHHATTSLMIQRILDEDLTGKTVIDMGTGSGILAILCAMRGADHVYAIEIDEAAYVNAMENVRLNGVEGRVSVIHGDADSLDEVQRAHLFLANINRNIITADVEKYASAMFRHGHLVLSGFYERDVPLIIDAAAPHALHYLDMTSRDDWASALFRKI